MALLRILDATKSPDQQQTFELSQDEVTLGREKDNLLNIVDPGISRHHCKLVRSGGGWTLVDSGSANGTWVNEVQVTERLLKNGDMIRLGKTYVQFSAPPEQAQTVLLDMGRQTTLPLPKPSSTPSPAIPSPPPAQAAPPTPPLPRPIPPSPPRQAAASDPPAPSRSAVPAPPASPAPPRYESLASEMSPPRQASASVHVPAFAARPVKPRGHGRPAAGVSPYAGFWIRLLAYFLDAVFLTILDLVIAVPAFLVGFFLLRNRTGLFLAVMGLAYLLVFAVSILYYVYFVGRRGATPGKKILGLRIVREDGIEPVGYGKAFLRLLGYLVSGMILYIGFIMIAFTDRKKGLHDMMVGTNVIKTNP